MGIADWVAGGQSAASGVSKNCFINFSLKIILTLPGTVLRGTQDGPAFDIPS